MCLIKVKIIEQDGSRMFENIAMIEIRDGLLILRDIFLREVVKISVDKIDELVVNTVDAVALLKLR